jgi:hypothetical protein
MSDAAETTTLNVDDVTKLILGARSGTSDPVSTSIAIFQGLSENAILSGDVLRLALSQASLSFEEPLTEVLAAVGGIAKTGSLVTFTNSQELRPVIPNRSPEGEFCAARLDFLRRNNRREIIPDEVTERLRTTYDRLFEVLSPISSDQMHELAVRFKSAFTP